MRCVIAILFVFLIWAGTLAQTNQLTRPEPPVPVTQVQVVELPLDRDRISQPLNLFGRAARDERGRCRAHHQLLREALVPIVYGLLPGTVTDRERESNEFPNAMTGYEGGCLVMGAKEAKVLQCRKCLRARKEWEENLKRRQR